MSALNDLPRNIVPADFFALILSSLGGAQMEGEAVDEHALLRLEGPGGGVWSVNSPGGDPRIDPVEGETSPAVVQVSLRVSDWREWVAGRIRDELATSTEVNLLDPRTLLKILSCPSALEIVRTLNGDLQVVVPDREEALEYVATVTLGGGAPSVEKPTTRVTVSLKDIGRMVRGEESPQEAFFTGKIRVDGDMNLAMAMVTVVSELRNAAVT